jgi:hypothetical protein
MYLGQMDANFLCAMSSSLHTFIDGREIQLCR